MNYERIRELLERLLTVYKKFDKDTVLTIAPPATQEEIEQAERGLGITIPDSLRRFFLEFSKECILYANFWKKIEMPEELSGIFSARIVLSLSEMTTAEVSRDNWTEVCFTDEEDEYDRMWYGKLGIMTVPNGDIIALDIAADPSDPPVVYLSHDDGEGHGYILGKNLSEYVMNLLMVGACGNEDWQVLPFCRDSTSGIDPTCEKAQLYRRLIGFDI